MSAFFRITSAHDAILVSDAHLGEVGNTINQDDIAQDRASPLVGIVLPSMPSFIFLTGLHHAVPLKINLSNLSGSMVPLRFIPMAHQGKFALMHPIRTQYLSAIVPHEATGYARVEGNRPEAAGWEMFRLHPLQSGEITERLELIAERANLLFRSGYTLETVLDMIRGYRFSGAPEALDAIMPFFSTAKISLFADCLFRDDALVQALAAQVPEDPWATEGIPLLKRWLMRRKDEGSICPAMTYSCAKEHTLLSVVGLDSDIGSFAHACLHAMRRTVLPSRGVAILACVRNEGNYLLEWIAHHRALGVEWFFLYSNDNEDGSDDMLRILAERGIVTWIANPVSPGTAAQHKAYGHALSIVPDILDFSWVQIIDADEFIVLDPARSSSINDYLLWTSTGPVDVIALNWRFVASEPLPTNDYKWLNDPLTMRNTCFVRQDIIGQAGSHLVKSMFRPSRVMQSRAHHPLSSNRYSLSSCLSDGSSHEWRVVHPYTSPSPGFADRLVFDGICIYHYFYKSPEEWVWKTARNRGDHPSVKGIDLSNFIDVWIGNFMSQVDSSKRHGKDQWLTFQRTKTRIELYALRKLPGMDRALKTVSDAFIERMALIRAHLNANDIQSQFTNDNRMFFSLIAMDRPADMDIPDESSSPETGDTLDDPENRITTEDQAQDIKRTQNQKAHVT